MAGLGDRSHDAESEPGPSLRCVWMTAGLLRYRLCDREFDCEHCPLDAALRGVDRPASVPADPASIVLLDALPRDRRYNRKHAWLAPVGGQRVRWGLDAFAVRLLGHVASVVLPAPGTHIVRDRAACWVKEETELVPLRAPISGLVTRVNRAVQLDPSLLATSPYEDGWLVELRCETPLEQRPDLAGAEAHARCTADDERELRDRVGRLVSGDPLVGPTLPDGGEPLVEWRRILGPERYLRLILPLLS